MPGSTGLLLARLVLPSLVRVVPLLLACLLLLMVLLFAGLLAGFLAGLFVGFFQAILVRAGLLTGYVLAMMFVVGGAFLFPVARV